MVAWHSVVLVAGQPAESPRLAGLLERVAGLSVIGRLVKNAAFGGAGRLTLVVPPGCEALVAEARAHWSRADGLAIREVPAAASELEALRGLEQPGDACLVVQFADVAYSRNLLQALVQEGAGTDQAVECVLEPERPSDDPFHAQRADGSRFAGLVLLAPGALAALGDRQGSLAEALEAARVAGLRLRRRPIAHSFVLRLRSPADLARAEALHVRHLRRNTDGIVSRWLNRPVSLFMTRHVFLKLPLTPNGITFLAGAIGWVAIGLMFAWPGYGLVLLGALLFHVSSVLDGCDGEVARLRFQFSRFGEWFDNVLDEVNNTAFIAGVGIGLWRHGAHEIYAWAAAFHVLAVATCDSATFFQLIRWRGGSGTIDKYRWFFQSEKKLAPGDPTAPPPRRSVFGWIQELPRRDFYIFMLLVLAIFDVLHVGFWISVGAGAVLFVLSLVQWVWQLREDGRRRAAR
ncbi:MAG TPA: CDP-alcohol phosphatidyltransferase family protein [Myxococcota bacterium]|nr:CDP-alcohol phosphatidyltransferase family protein [Myxococcota bacterium]HRY94013.1 CDP-alcohol phosphatidyltransferase family protein [Myxococcota bacterium]